MKNNAIISLLLFLLAFQCVMSMKQKSPTSDETPHLAAGYSYWKTGSFRMNPEHPPLIKLLAGIPLLFMKLDFPSHLPSWEQGEEWSFGEQFIYNNRVPAEKIIFAGRIPIVILSILLGLLVFQWAKEIYGINSGLMALFFYVFCPNILAHSGLVTMDLGISLFTVLSLYSFYHFLHEPKIKNVIFAGISLGLALSTKFSAINIFPLYFILGMIFLLKDKKNNANLLKVVLPFCLIVIIAILITMLTYGFSAMNNYFVGLSHVADEVKARGHINFLAGQYSNQGWWYYFIVAFFLKTPIPMIILLLFTILFLFLVKKSSVKLQEYFIIIPAILIFGVSSFSHKQIGLRYILQVYPFLFIWISSIMTKQFNPKKYLIPVLLVWYAWGAFKTYPHYLSYFNEFIGGPKNGYKYLIDSNLDWGQDLPGLRDYIKKEGNPEIILSFFGSASPRAYGITYQNFYSYNLSGRPEEHINSPSPSRELLVMSANALQCLYFSDKHILDWLKDTPTVKVIGYSLFVYDITNDEVSHFNLGIFYMHHYAGTELKKAEREFMRVLSINPSNDKAKQYMEWIKNTVLGAK